MPYYRKKGHRYSKKKYYGSKNSESGNSERAPTVRAHRGRRGKSYSSTTQPAGNAFSGLYKAKTKLRYSTSKSFLLQGVSYQTFQFRANSIYDPDAQVGISQRAADGWAEMNFVYGKYMVKGAKIRVTMTQSMNATDPANVIANQMMFYLKIRGDDVKTEPNPASVMLNGNAVWKIYQPPSVGTFQTTLEGYYDPVRLLGPEANPKSASWDQFGSAMDDNPTQEANWIIGLATADGSGVTAACSAKVQIEIDYYVQFSEPKSNVLTMTDTADDMIRKGQAIVKEAKERMEKRKAMKKEQLSEDAEMERNEQEEERREADIGSNPDEVPTEDEQEEEDDDQEPASQVEETVNLLLQQVKGLGRKRKPT